MSQRVSFDPRLHCLFSMACAGRKPKPGAHLRFHMLNGNELTLRKQMSRLLVVTCVGISCSTASFSGELRQQFTIDATHQPVPASRGMGPLPGSNHPGHSAGFPIVLDLVIGTAQLGEGGRGFVDFVITNVGHEPITLPVSVENTVENTPPTQVLTLYISVADGGGPVDLTTSAELYGDSADPETFRLLARGKTMRVHASTRFRLPPGPHLLTAHAELLRQVGGTSKLVGTAESVGVQKLFTVQTPATQ